MSCPLVMLWKIASAFIFILVVVGAAIAFLPHRPRSAHNSSINIARQLDGAKRQWELERQKLSNDLPTWGEPRSAGNACINILRQIDGAKQQWAIENHKLTNDVPTWADIQPYLRGDRCPDGGTYTIGPVRDLPTCSIASQTNRPALVRSRHKLPPGIE